MTFEDIVFHVFDHYNPESYVEEPGEMDVDQAKKVMRDVIDRALGGYERTSGSSVPLNRVIEKRVRNDFRKKVRENLYRELGLDDTSTKRDDEQDHNSSISTES